MKIRCLLALLGLAISFALPTPAQQTDTVDPQTIQQLAADIVVREGDDWKVRLDIWNVTPPPAK
jgi:hypothetical protein